MTDNPCRCTRPAGEAYVCRDCIDALGRALGDVPWLETELDLTLSRQRRFGTGNGGSRDAERPMPYNVGASAAMGHLRAILVGWVRLCDEEHVRSADYRVAAPENTLTAMSRFLLWRTDGLALHEAGSDAVDEITAAVEKCRRVIDRPTERTYAGPCDECGEDLYAMHGKSTATCTPCGLDYDLTARRVWLLEQVHDRLATTREISRALTSLDLPIHEKRIADWKYRDRLKVKAHDAKGRPMYRVGDVIELMTEDKSKAGAR